MKRYLGDGVYADIGWGPACIVLTTENGYATTNRIVLEPEVLAALEAYIELVNPSVPAGEPKESEQ